MAITQAGTTLTINVAPFGSSGTASSTITVPADAEIVIAGLSSFDTTSDLWSAGTFTFTKGGTDVAMTAVGGAQANTAWQCAAWYLVLPDTGANKSLKYTVAHTPNQDFALMSLTFWKGIDTASPVRDTDAAQASGLPYTTPTLTAVSGDLIVAVTGSFTGGAGTIDSWSNLTLLNNLTNLSASDAAWATGSPTGNTTVEASTGTNIDDGGIVAIVLKPLSGGSILLTAQIWL